jgi:hypothetical protein
MLNHLLLPVLPRPVQGQVHPLYHLGFRISFAGVLVLILFMDKRN